MRYNNLGHSEIKVSELCLGSMTWGTQNTPQDAFEQIDMALDYGVNFIDTAEMYPTTPLGKDTQGDTERIIGDWIAQSGRRSDVIIATKVSGKGYKNVRDGAPISPASITTAIENSLRHCALIILIFISSIGRTADLICFAKTGHMTQHNKTQMPH